MSPDPDRSTARDFSIRLATNADETAIRRVLYSVRLEYDVHQDGDTGDGNLADIERNYFAAGGCFEVVEDAAGRIVGCAGLCRLSERRAELCKMYIEKPARGHGLGKRLLEDMLAVARRSGFAEVWLETNSTLLKAISLYARYGFRPVPSDHLLCRCDQAYLIQL